MVVTIPMAEVPQVFGADSPLATTLSAWAEIPAPDEEARLIAALAAEHRARAQGRALMLRAMTLLHKSCGGFIVRIQRGSLRS